MINGIINVLKPPGMTSHDVVYFVRRVLKMKKVGHIGTLDPEAAGVLPVCIGKATKVVQYLTDKKKSYRANIKFGTVTDTYDKYGKTVEECSLVQVDAGRLEEVLKSFTGTISQRPPIYSAVKVKGKKLYQYALEGKDVQIEERQVEIYGLRLVDIIAPDEAIIDIDCSKGTYIRSLCHDIGEALGCGAHMSQLVRLESTPFAIENSKTLEEIENAQKEDRLAEIINSVEILFESLKKVYIKTTALSSILNGNPLFEQGLQEGLERFEEGEDVRIYGQEGFIGIGVVKFEDEKQRKYIKLKNIFI
ncbi:MAG: tRNA pseudouridine(55) synthase TruB [Caulobacteraceae bacterium]